MNNQNNHGFVLTELVVVLVIIGLLAVIAIPNFKRYQFIKECNQDKKGQELCYENQKGKSHCGTDYARQSYCRQLSMEHLGVKYHKDLTCQKCSSKN